MDDEFTDDDDEQMFDDFQDEYPFDMVPAENITDENTNDEEQPSSLDSDAININAESAKILEEFDLESFSKELLNKAGTGDLVTCLNKHWAKYVPLCYTITDNPLKNLIEKDSSRILFKPFEIFISNDQNSEKVLEDLKQLDDPPLLCGHVFKTGEPSYCCRDCGSDPTCVLCSDCFLNSKHRNHKYKMMTSAGGGGYCDCGDVEAWKEHPSCEKHTKKDNNEQQSAEDLIQKLPSDLVQRARQLFDYLLEYVIEMLSGDIKESLPAHLKPEKDTDDYITILFNDEIHSYEQVMRTLKRVLNVDEKKAFEYATVVDREGRSSIKHGKKAQCDQIKSQVEHEMSGQALTPPLETKVMHHSVVAHQHFAEEILSWLQKFTECSKGLKHVLCQSGFTPRNDNSSIVEKLMLSDSLLWKSARTIVHQYFIAVYFMDTNWKKEFAVMYTKNYQLIWRNYVKNPDDTVSLTDLAVQLFTVISLIYKKIYDKFMKVRYHRSSSVTKLLLQIFTNNSLSKYLITNFNLLQIIMDTLLEQSKAKLNAKGRFGFQRARTNNEFKRAQFILFDLKYCLISIPDSWNDKLRESFLNGFKSFVQFLKLMHGMDAIKRHIDQHIEFEPEWETAFNLLIKLQKSTTSLIDWCASDAYVLKESYEYLLKVLNEISLKDSFHDYKYETKKYFNKEYRIIEYDITKQEVSIHAPLTRLLAALHKKLNIHSIDFKSFSIIQNEQLTLNYLIEPSLSALSMVAQTNVGLWRRNGYSLLSQVYFYSNVKCRTEMYDRDIESMQLGAALMDPNEFIVSILARLRILDYWSKENPEGKTDDTKLEYLNLLAEEFLQLLIIVIGERFEPNVSMISAKDKLKREVIHQLCISPMAHSDIIKNLYPDNELNVNDLETVLREVAVFKSPPNPSAKGTYELKQQYFNDYNPYFYHYSRIDKTKSEEYVLKQKHESKRFLPPAVLPQFTKDYASIRNILQSEILMKIINIVLKRFTTKSKTSSEGQLVRVFHLIGMALHEEQQKTQYGTNDQFKFCEKVSKQKTADSLLTHLTNAIPLIQPGSYKLLANWTLQLLESLCTSTIKTESPSSSDIAMKAEEDESKELAKEKRKNQSKAKAEQRRLKILAQMSDMQKDFIKKNKDFFDETQPQVEVAGISSAVEMEEGFEQRNYVCLGPNQSQNLAVNSVKRYRCILCQEDQEISLKNPPMVLCAYIQHSKVLSKESKRNIENIDKFDPLFMPNTLYWGVHTTTCGHVMHGSCWRKYVDGVKAHENRNRSRPIYFNTKRDEFLCPLCETIGNTVLPLLPNFKEFTNQSQKIIDITYDDWLDGLKNTLDHSIQKELDDKDVFIINPFPLSSITKFMAEAVARNFNLLFSYTCDSTNSNAEPKILEETMNIIDVFARAAFIYGLIVHPNDDDQRMPIVTWNNCAYTIQTLEEILRSEHKPIFSQLPARQADLLSNLIKFASLYAVAKEMKHVREYCFKMLAAILPYNSVFFDAINIMDCDPFHLLVYLCFAMPYLYDNTTLSSAPCGNINEAYIFKLLFQVHCVQILTKKIKNNSFNETVDSNEFTDECMDLNDDVTEQDKKIYELFEYILSVSKVQNENFVKPCPKTVTNALKIGLMPFMRCSVLFFNYTTDITPPFIENDKYFYLEVHFNLRLILFLMFF